MDLEANLETLTDVRNRLQQELVTSRERVQEVEHSLGRATATISSLQKVIQEYHNVNCVHGFSHTDISDGANSTLGAQNYYLQYYFLLREVVIAFTGG